MKYTGERFMPQNTDGGVTALEHLHRYMWARQFVENKKVLDIACGEGYGSAILAEKAKTVCGVDICGECVANARKKYPYIEFIEADIANFVNHNDNFDVIVCFETLEHLELKKQETALQNLQNLLSDDGILIISTPNTASPLYIKNNKFHKKEFSKNEFEIFLLKYFENVKIVNQDLAICSIIGNKETDNSEIISVNEAVNGEAKYLIGLCSKEKIGEITGSVMTDREGILLQKLTQIRNYLAKFDVLYMWIRNKVWRKK